MVTFILSTTSHHTFPSAQEGVQLEPCGHVGNVGSSGGKGRAERFLTHTLYVFVSPAD